MNYSELLQLAKGWGNFVSDRINIWRLPIINLGVSIVLVNFIGLVGVAVGTFSAVMFRYIYYVIFLARNIMQLNVLSVLKRALINIVNILLLGLFAFIIGDNFNLYTIYGWITGAIIMLFISTCVTCLLNYCFYRREFMVILNKVTRR